jgi:hypothetical protein
MNSLTSFILVIITLIILGSYAYALFSAVT